MKLEIEITPEELQEFGEKYQRPISLEHAKIALGVVMPNRARLTRIKDEILSTALDIARLVPLRSKIENKQSKRRKT